MDKDWLDKLLEGATLITESIGCRHTQVIDSLQCRSLLGEETCDLINYQIKEGRDTEFIRRQLKEFDLYN